MAHKPMDRDEAVIVLMDEARNMTQKQPGKNRCARIVRACATLGLEGDQLRHTLAYLELVRHDTGEPWTPYIKRTW